MIYHPISINQSNLPERSPLCTRILDAQRAHSQRGAARSMWSTSRLLEFQQWVKTMHTNNKLIRGAACQAPLFEFSHMLLELQMPLILSINYVIVTRTVQIYSVQGTLIVF